MSIFYSRSDEVNFKQIDFDKPTCLPISRKDSIRTHSFLNGWRSVQIKDGTRLNRGSLAKLVYKHYLYEYKDGKSGYRKIKAELVKLMKQNPDEFKKAKTQEEAIAILLGKLQEGNSETKERIKIKDARKLDSTPTLEATSDSGTAQKATGAKSTHVPVVIPENFGPSEKRGGMPERREGMQSNLDETQDEHLALRNDRIDIDVSPTATEADFVLPQVQAGKKRLASTEQKLEQVARQIANCANSLEQGSDDRVKLEELLETLKQAKEESQRAGQSDDVEKIKETVSANIEAVDNVEAEARELVKARARKMRQQLKRLNDSPVWKKDRAKQSALAREYHYRVEQLADYTPRANVGIEKGMEWLAASHNYLRPLDVGTALSEEEMQKISDLRKDHYVVGNDASEVLKQASALCHHLNQLPEYQGDVDEIVRLVSADDTAGLEKKVNELKQRLLKKVEENQQKIQDTHKYCKDKYNCFSGRKWQKRVELLRFGKALRRLNKVPNQNSSLEKLTEWVFLLDKCHAEGMEFSEDYVNKALGRAEQKEAASRSENSDIHVGASDLRAEIIAQNTAGYGRLIRDYEEMQAVWDQVSPELQQEFEDLLGGKPENLIAGSRAHQRQELSDLGQIERGEKGETKLLQEKADSFVETREKWSAKYTQARNLFIRKILPTVNPNDIRVTLSREVYQENSGSMASDPGLLLNDLYTNHREAFQRIFEQDEDWTNFTALEQYATGYYEKVAKEGFNSTLKHPENLIRKHMVEEIDGKLKPVVVVASELTKEKFNALPTLSHDQLASRGQLIGWAKSYEENAMPSLDQDGQINRTGKLSARLAFLRIRAEVNLLS